MPQKCDSKAPGFCPRLRYSVFLPIERPVCFIHFVTHSSAYQKFKIVDNFSIDRVRVLGRHLERHSHAISDEQMLLPLHKAFARRSHSLKEMSVVKQC